MEPWGRIEKFYVVPENQICKIIELLDSVETVLLKIL